MPQSAQKSLLAQLPSQCIANPDDKMRFFVGWWQRMHEDVQPPVAVSLKFVEWSAEGTPAKRFVWEVCRWPRGRSVRWTFMCWMIDGDGMWTKPFPSKRSALAYFGQAPAVVLARSAQPDGEGVTEAGPHKVAS
jgi:hypothetical protein